MSIRLVYLHGFYGVLQGSTGFDGVRFWEFYRFGSTRFEPGTW
jgi:hypothetical protein